jgi:hypothetical protein
MIENFLYPEDNSTPSDEININKAWDGIHFLLP